MGEWKTGPTAGRLSPEPNGDVSRVGWGPRGSGADRTQSAQSRTNCPKQSGSAFTPLWVASASRTRVVGPGRTIKGSVAFSQGPSLYAGRINLGRRILRSVNCGRHEPLGWLAGGLFGEEGTLDLAPVPNCWSYACTSHFSCQKRICPNSLGIQCYLNRMANTLINDKVRFHLPCRISSVRPLK